MCLERGRREGGFSLQKSFSEHKNQGDVPKSRWEKNNKIKAVFSQASRNCYSLNYRKCGLADLLDMLYSTGRAQILNVLMGVMKLAMKWG
jgi:hypothetical protein